MKICIIGTGYVGLVTGISLAALGHKVICVDNDKHKISTINNGISPFYEPGLEAILKKLLRKNNLFATEDLEKSVKGSDIIIIAVGTPTGKGKIDLSFIKKASRQIGRAMLKTNKYQVVAVKSTVLPGVSEKIVKPMIEKYSKREVAKDFGLCMNPEFLREGSALEDALNPDRIIIGRIDDKSGKEFAKIYKKVSVPKLFTNLSTAEMTKYASNALFATLISYSNEIARISEKTEGVDVIDVWAGVHLDKRLNPFQGKIKIKPGVLSYIFSGCGFGGSCFPKDTKALLGFANDQGVQASLIKSVIDINNTQPHQLLILLKNVLGDDLREKRIAILGLSFKPNTDDIRESPSLQIIKKLLAEKVKLICHDPFVYKSITPNSLQDRSIVLAKNIKEAIINADAVIIITAWDEYIKLSPRFFKKYMKKPIVIDGRRIYDKSSFINAGIIYKGIGL